MDETRYVWLTKDQREALADLETCIRRCLDYDISAPQILCTADDVIVDWTDEEK